MLISTGEAPWCAASSVNITPSKNKTPKTTSFKSWAERLVARAESEEVTRELYYWTTPARRRSYPIPVDYPGASNTIGSAKTFSVVLNTQDTQALLQTIPTAFNTRIDEVLLTALALTFDISVTKRICL